eukprot:3266254-Alexandrium_andersonii.AAC.1
MVCLVSLKCSCSAAQLWAGGFGDCLATLSRSPPSAAPASPSILSTLLLSTGSTLPGPAARPQCRRGGRGRPTQARRPPRGQLPPGQPRLPGRPSLWGTYSSVLGLLCPAYPPLP